MPFMLSKGCIFICFRPVIAYRCLAFVMLLTVSVAGRANIHECDSVINNPEKISESDGIGTLIPNAAKLSPGTGHFAWGAEVGSSVDLTGNNLTTFDANIYCGWKNSFFQMAGVGVGMQRSIGNGNSFIPFFAMLRTSFRNRPSRFFFNLKGGYSFNTLSSGHSKGGFQFSAGGGMVLKRTKLLQSYIMLAYGYYHISHTQVDELNLDIKHVDFAQIIFGITF